MEKSKAKNAAHKGKPEKQNNNKTASRQRSETTGRFKLILKRTAALLTMIIFIGLLSAVGFLLIQNFKRIDQLRNEVVVMRSAMNTDSVRQHILQKILKIINDHNPEINSEIAYDIANTIHEMSLKYSNLDVDLLSAMITHESANTWDPEIVSPAGAMGLMQIMPVTGMFLAEYEGIPWTNPEDVLFDPQYNIRLGARYLSSLIQEYDLEVALAAYNGGERIAAVYLANGKDDQFLWEETRNYIPAVKSLYTYYAQSGL